MKPLENLRVVDATSGPVGGLATMVLADFGAEVVKVESRDGRPCAGRAAFARLAARQTQCRLRRFRTHRSDRRVRPMQSSPTARSISRVLRRDRPDLVCGAIVPFDGLPLDEGLIAARLGRMMRFAASSIAKVRSTAPCGLRRTRSRRRWLRASSRVSMRAHAPVAAAISKRRSRTACCRTKWADCSSRSCSSVVSNCRRSAAIRTR